MRNTTKRCVPVDHAKTEGMERPDSSDTPRRPYERPRIVEDIYFSTFSMTCGPNPPAGCDEAPDSGYSG